MTTTTTTVRELQEERAELERVIADCKDQVEDLEASARGDLAALDHTRVAQINRQRRGAGLRLKEVERELAERKREARASSWAVYADAFIAAARRRLKPETFADLHAEAQAAAATR